MFDQRTQEMLERVSDAIVVFDTQWRYIYLNCHAEEILQRRRADILGKAVLEISPQSMEFPLYKACQEAMATQEPGEQTFFSLRASRWLKASYYPSAEGLTLYFSDHTLLKVAEEGQLRSEARVRRLVDSNLLGIIFWSLDGSITEANEVFLHMLGYTREDLAAGLLNWRMLTPAKYISQDNQAIEELRLFGEVKAPFEKEYLHKNGLPIPVIIGATMMDNSQKEGVAFVLDIRERKKIERMKDDFISMASHELKTPLTSLKGFTQILQRRFQRQEDEQAISLLARMDLQLNRLTQLVSGLLDLSTIQSGGLTYYDGRFDLCDLLTEIAKKAQLSTSLRLVVEGEQPLPMRGDRHRLQQVFTNLLSNALKYSPKGQQIILNMQREGADALVSIQDFGIGITPEHLERIFERFYRADGQYEMTFPGLGIGLFVSQEIVRHHRGSIQVNSQPGVGSTFVVRLPLTLSGHTNN